VLIMAILELTHTPIFDADMDRLRQQCFPGAYPTGSSRDEFDEGSMHIVTRCDGHLAGAGRLIHRPTAFYRSVFDDCLLIPDEPDVAYFGRIMVAPEHRGHDLFEVLMVDGLLYACDAGFRLVFGGMHPARKFWPFVEELGFRKYGEPKLGNFPEGNLHQPLVAETHGRRELWSCRKRAALDRLRANGCAIIDRGCPVEPANGGGDR
jgi:hypothetical protein